MAFVIGVAAQAQMGKDTLSDYLQEKLNERLEEKRSDHVWGRAAFAANVKKVYQDTFDVDGDFVEEWKTKDEVPPGFDMPVRKSLQFIGDGFRKIRSTIWLDLCFRDSVPKIISDVRYVNEFLRVKKEGGLNILIGRPDRLNDDANGSEAQIRPYVEFALDEEGGFRKKFNNLSHYTYGGDNTPPKDFDKFDVFIRNDGTIEELYEIIDKELVPFVENFVFDFPQKTEEKDKCLISH